MKLATPDQTEKAAAVCITEEELEIILEIWAKANPSTEEVDRLFSLMIDDARESMRRTLLRAMNVTSNINS